MTKMEYQCLDCKKGFEVIIGIPLPTDKECPYCKSKEIVKNGARKTSAGTKQRFKCLDCKKRFVLEPIKHRFPI
jgi:DNA-directed RNA polymerase subunit RPC12/RpoP